MRTSFPSGPNARDGLIEDSLKTPFTREVNRQLKETWNASSTDQNLCSDFT